MATLRQSTLPSQARLFPSYSISQSKFFISSLQFRNSHLNPPSVRIRISTPQSASPSTTVTSTTAAAPNPATNSETFDWYSQWYPLATLCDLDKQAPKSLTVMGLDVVIWWDRVEGTWKVFDDRCPHRLAPLSEGRIDHRGRLQCVYHGWCFDGAGSCKYIPQAPALGPPVHKNEKACVAVYPSIVQSNILWFWPDTSSKYKDNMQKTTPPNFPELDDPSYFHMMLTRDVPYGYEVLTENLLDPAHLPYSHYGILNLVKHEDPVETDREGGTPIKITIEKSDINGFDGGSHKFIAPCVVYLSLSRKYSVSNEDCITVAEQVSFLGAKVIPRFGVNYGAHHENYDKASVNELRSMTILLCIPVSPGKSRVMTISAWNFANWMDKLLPQWHYHTIANLVIDSDLRLLHAQERKLASEGNNWHKACYAPTQSDAMVVAFRSWLRKYSNNQVNWRAKDATALPATPSSEQLMDRYWSHVVHCKCCSGALRTLKAIKVSLQIASVALIGILAAGKPSITSSVTKAAIVSIAIMFSVASLWLPQFIYKTFHYHDYDHSTYRSTLVKRILEAFGASSISVT